MVRVSPGEVREVRLHFYHSQAPSANDLMKNHRVRVQIVPSIPLEWWSTPGVVDLAVQSIPTNEFTLAAF